MSLADVCFKRQQNQVRLKPVDSTLFKNNHYCIIIIVSSVKAFLGMECVLPLSGTAVVFFSTEIVWP
jgi:hypothetical protein